MADARDCDREREKGKERETRIWFAWMNQLSRSCEIFSVFCCRPRLKLLLNCHNLWRIMSKLVAVRWLPAMRTRLQLDCRAKRLPIHAAYSPGSPGTILSAPLSLSLCPSLLHVTSRWGKEAAQSVSARKPRLWVAFPSLQFVCFPTNSLHHVVHNPAQPADPLPLSPCPS